MVEAFLSKCTGQVLEKTVNSFFSFSGKFLTTATSFKDKKTFCCITVWNPALPLFLAVFQRIIVCNQKVRQFQENILVEIAKKWSSRSRNEKIALGLASVEMLEKSCEWVPLKYTEKHLH